MLRLTDSRRMAHKYGKKRGRHIAIFGVACWLLALLLANLNGVMHAVVMRIAPNGMPPAVSWAAMVVYAVGCLLVLYGARLIYRDEVHQAYIADADHYQRHGS